MRLEFLASGSPDAPLIRLYGTDLEALLELSRGLEQLSRRVSETVDVHRIASITAIDNCRLTFESVHERPRSLVTQRGKGLDFIGRDTCEDWVTVHGLVEPFLKSARSAVGFHGCLVEMPGDSSVRHPSLSFCPLTRMVVGSDDSRTGTPKTAARPVIGGRQDGLARERIAGGGGRVVTDWTAG